MLRNSRRAESTLSMRGFSSNLKLDPLSSLLSNNINENYKRLNSDENLMISSHRSVNSMNSITQVNNGLKSDAYENESDALSRELDKFNINSNPASLKYIPHLQSELSSRSSQRKDPLINQNNVDKYFTDLNGNSLISTLHSTNELFSSISSSNFMKRSSLLSGNKTNRGINAANQILFGSHASVVPAYHNSPRQESQERFSHEVLSQSNFGYDLK